MAISMKSLPFLCCLSVSRNHLGRACDHNSTTRMSSNSGAPPCTSKERAALQKDGPGLASSPNREQGRHPDVLPCVIPGIPLHLRCPAILSTAEINAQRKLQGRCTAHVLAPGFDLVGVPRDALRFTMDAGFGADEIKRVLLGAMPTPHI